MDQEYCVFVHALLHSYLRCLISLRICIRRDLAKGRFMYIDIDSRIEIFSFNEENSIAR